MQQIQSTITIDAPAERVLAMLTDFGADAEWNPFLGRASGRPVVGERLTIRFHPPGSAATTLTPEVLVTDAPRELRWRGQVLIPGLLDAVHTLRLDPDGPDRVRISQHETFSGLLKPLFGSTLSNGQKGFEAMNQALKARVEQDARVLGQLASYQPQGGGGSLPPDPVRRQRADLLRALASETCG